jgi:hypothetical protein
VNADSSSHQRRLLLGRHAAELGHRLDGEQVHLRVGDRAQAARRARRVVEVELVDLGRAVEQRAPHDHAGVLGRRVGGDGELADARADAVGADDDVVAGARAVGQLDLWAVERLHRRAEAHLDADLLRGAEQDRVQRPAQHADRAGVLGAGEPRQVRRRAAGARRVVVAELGHAEAGLDDRVEQPERPERAQRGGLQRDARARDRPLGLVVGDEHLHAAATERPGQRQAADATADDEHTVHGGRP